MVATPSPQFEQNVRANLAYWQQCTENLQETDLTAVYQERHNLYRALQYGSQLPTGWREAAQLALQCFPLIEQGGYWHEWLPILTQLQARCEEADWELNGRLLNNLGIFYRYDRQLEKSLNAHWQEIEIGTKWQDNWRLAHAHINLAATQRALRQYDQADQHAIAARTHFSVINAPLVKFAFVAHECGLIAQAREDWEAAEKHQRKAIALWRDINQPVPLAQALKMLSQIVVKQGDVATAKQLIDEALSLLNAVTNELDRSRLLLDLGTLHFDDGQWAEAERCFLAADSATLQLAHHQYDQATLNNNLGNVYLKMGKLDKAANHLQVAIDLWRRMDDEVQLANSMGTLAEVQQAKGQMGKAQRLFAQALTLLAPHPDDGWSQRLRRKLAHHPEQEEPEPVVIQSA